VNDLVNIVAVAPVIKMVVVVVAQKQKIYNSECVFFAC